MYSALKRGGQRLYELARAGVEVERKPRTVQMHRLEVLDFDLPQLVLEVECGRGLYLRSLAHDLGQALGCGGHLSSLVRLRAGPFYSEESIPLDGLRERCLEGTWEEMLYPIDFPLLFMKAIRVDRGIGRMLRNGQSASLGPQAIYATHMESRRAYDEEGRFLGVVRMDKSQGKWRPYKMFRAGSPSSYAPT
jgi:tRNA pseudouridine55 synthase